MPQRTLTKAELSKLFKDTAHRDWHNASIESRIPREIRDVSFPNDEAIFLAFKDLKPSEVRYVILGQDPYYTRLKSGTPMATGLAFDVPIDCEQKERPYSWRRIARHVPLQGRTLGEWAKSKKVLLLNAALTVPERLPGQHLNAWNDFTSAVIAFMKDGRSATPKFICWGQEARTIAENSGLEIGRDIVWSHHPAARTKGENPHSFANFWKNEIGQALIE